MSRAPCMTGLARSLSHPGLEHVSCALHSHRCIQCHNRDPNCHRHRRESITAQPVNVGTATGSVRTPRSLVPSHTFKKVAEVHATRQLACMRSHMLACGWPKEDLHGSLAASSPRVRLVCIWDREVREGGGIDPDPRQSFENDPAKPAGCGRGLMLL